MVEKDKESSDDIEIIDDDLDHEIPSGNRQWTKRKLRGFKKINTGRLNQVEEDKRKETNTHRINDDNIEERNENRRNNKETTDRIRYCHYYVNSENCSFEDRTGKKCKFQHSVAPMCRFGVNCSRFRYMYSHPKQSSNIPFLQHRTNSSSIVNPWLAMNPWTVPPMNMHPNSLSSNLMRN